MPLYGHELEEATSPLHAVLGWAVAKMGDYGGAAAGRRLRENGLDRRLQMLQIDGQVVARADDEVQLDSTRVARVTRGSFSPALQRPIAMACVEAGVGASGTQLDVLARGWTNAATVVKRPFCECEQPGTSNGGAARS